MTHPPHTAPPHSAPRPLPEPTIRMTEGWHCLHLYYRVDQSELNRLDEAGRARGREELSRLLDPEREGAPERLQTSLVAGHKADLGLLIMDADPLKINSVRQAIRSSPLGPALVPVYSFVSITEVSEYVPTVEQYGERLKHDGTSESDPAYQAKINAYAQRLPMMNKQRLYPDLPPLPVTCFYPMNKIRHPQANWYQAPFSDAAPRCRSMPRRASSSPAASRSSSRPRPVSTTGNGASRSGAVRPRTSRRSSTRWLRPCLGPLCGVRPVLHQLRGFARGAL